MHLRSSHDVFQRFVKILFFGPPTQSHQFLSLYRHPQDWGDPSPLFRASMSSHDNRFSTLTKFCVLDPPPSLAGSHHYDVIRGTGGTPPLHSEPSFSNLGPTPSSLEILCKLNSRYFQAPMSLALTYTIIYFGANPALVMRVGSAKIFI